MLSFLLPELLPWAPQASRGVVEPERPQLLSPGQLSSEAQEAQGSLDLAETGREEVQPRTPPSPSAFQPQMKSHLWLLGELTEAGGTSSSWR